MKKADELVTMVEATPDVVMIPFARAPKDILTRLEEPTVKVRRYRNEKRYFVCSGSFERMHTRFAYPLKKAKRVISRAKRLGVKDVYLSSPVTARVEVG